MKISYRGCDIYIAGHIHVYTQKREPKHFKNIKSAEAYLAGCVGDKVDLRGLIQGHLMFVGDRDHFDNLH